MNGPEFGYRVWAGFVIGGTTETFSAERERSPDYAFAIPGVSSAGPAVWTAPDPPEFDDETAAALKAAAAGVPVTWDPEGVSPSQRIPLLIEHGEKLIVPSLEVSRGVRILRSNGGGQGIRFTATGWVTQAGAERVRRYRHVSDRLAIGRAKVIDVPFMGRFVRVTASVLEELSVTNTPAFSDTFLMVGDRLALPSTVTTF